MKVRQAHFVVVLVLNVLLLNMLLVGCGKHESSRQGEFIPTQRQDCRKNWSQQNQARISALDETGRVGAYAVMARICQLTAGEVEEFFK